MTDLTRRATFLAPLAMFGATKQPNRTIVWNPDTAELSWVGTTDNKTKYVLNFRTRLMTADGKVPKRFKEQEQATVLAFLMQLEAYTMESEDWYPDPERYDERHEQKHLEQYLQPRRA
jgi:hypothetical protein